MFDPYAAKITHVNQWITITRLPQEYWEDNHLTSLLAGVWVFLKTDEYTLNRGKGKFASVFLNMDVSKPLQGTLTIPTSDAFLHFPISCKELHEVCAICGSTAHALDGCPDSPKNVFKVVVEKIGATTLQADVESGPPTCEVQDTIPFENWATVSPKKRSRLPSAHKKRGILPTPSRFTSPKVTTVLRPEVTPIIILTDTSDVGGTSISPNGCNSEINNWDTMLNKGTVTIAHGSPSQGAELPIDDEDDTDMFLKLEGDIEPQ